jgi:flagellin
MSLVINTNMSSITAQRHLQNSRADMEQAMERLSSGKRINSAMDDAAGLTIAHSLDAKVTSLQQATRNANDAISLINLAEGALDQVSTMLSRMRELAVQSLNGTYSQTDRTNINSEFEALATEITRISDNTKFNDIAVIGAAANLVFQVGHTSTDTITLATLDMAATAIGTTTALSGTQASTTTLAAAALTVIDNSIADVDSYRATLGATANRMVHSAANLMTRSEYQMAARSRIEDADYAVEAANLAKSQILQQAGTSMLSQANASTQTVLSLLK